MVQRALCHTYVAVLVSRSPSLTGEVWTVTLPSLWVTCVWARQVSIRHWSQEQLHKLLGRMERFTGAALGTRPLILSFDPRMILVGRGSPDDNLFHRGRK